MDTITHGLLGATVAQLGFRQRLGREATWVALLATITPDLDILITPIFSLTGSEVDGFSAIANHRGITHSLLAIPLIALAIALIWRWVKRGSKPSSDPPDADCPSSNPSADPPFGMMYLCVFLAMLSHLLLDGVTSYGTQLLTPLTHRRLALDAIAIIDIIYTPILILTLLICFLLRKIRTDSRKATLVAGWTGFLLSVAYLGLGLGFHQYVLSKMKKATARTAVVAQPVADACEFHAYPQLGTILVWRVTRYCRDEWTVGKMNVLFGADPEKSAFNRVRQVDNEWVRRAREIPEVQRFQWFTLGQMRADYTRRGPFHLVEFFDMRYGPRPESVESLWSMRVTFDELARTWLVEYIHHHRGAKLRQIVSQALRDIVEP